MQIGNKQRIFLVSAIQTIMKYAKFYLPLLLICLDRISFQPLFENRRSGAAANPIRIALTPSVDARKVTNSADKLQKFLERQTGYAFSIVVPTSYIAVVEAFGSGMPPVDPSRSSSGCPLLA